MKRTTALLVAIAMIALCFCGCTGKPTQETTTVEATEATTVETTKKEKVYDKKTNLLTGIPNLSDGAIGKRPVAVMVNNIKKSLPQYGISDADIIFEVLVEGGITRMMALYGDYTRIPNVCSVRSCRYYFPIFAHGFDAVYCCFGSNQSLGTTTLKRIKIDYFDGQFYSALYGRDAERKKTYAKEHTAYLKGSDVPATLKKEGVRSDILKGRKEPFFNFNSPNKPKKVSDTVCNKATLNFSKFYWSGFTYDKASKTYLKTHEEKAHIDQKTGNQLAFTNVLVLTTSVNEFNDGTGLIKVDWKGGSGCYLSMGTAKPIKWSKASESAPIKLTDKNGKPLKLNAGKSYIGVIPSSGVKLDTKTTK